MVFDIGIFETFDETKSSWERWLTRFESSYDICALKNDIKLKLLLHFIGIDTFDLLCEKFAPSTPEEKTYEVMKNTLKAIFDPSPLEIVENYRFHLRKQAEDESVEEFSIALRKLALHCKFGNYLDTAYKIDCWRPINSLSRVH